MENQRVLSNWFEWASVSGYCSRFKTPKDINNDILEAAIRSGVAAQNEKDEPMK